MGEPLAVTSDEGLRLGAWEPACGDRAKAGAGVRGAWPMHSITRVTQELRENVIRRNQTISGLRVVEVNVAVNDVHLVDDH